MTKGPVLQWHGTIQIFTNQSRTEMLEDNRQPLRDRMSRVNRQESSLSHLPRLARQPVLLPHRRWGRSMEVQVSEFAEYGDVPRQGLAIWPVDPCQSV